MAPKAATAAQLAQKAQQKAQRELEDLQLVLKARNGDQVALDQLIRRYTGFVRLKASSYFLAGGDSEDLIQEGLIGLYKAVRDFRTDKETSFRSFAELCVTRQIITAIKTATRFKHQPLNSYVSFSHTPAGQDTDCECTHGDALRLYLEGCSYEQMAADLGCDTKTIDNALQRVKRKVLQHQQTRQVLS
jgi:RNA polymerase sporulation-specific sigma factor